MRQHLTFGLVVGILLHLSGVELIIVRRQYHDGILFEDFATESDNVRYTITGSEGWDDLDTLVESNQLSQKAMFCSRGPGAWLLYHGLHFGYGFDHKLILVYGEYCVPVDSIKSIQPLGGLFLKITDASTVIGFNEVFFSSVGVQIKDGESQSVKSAIFLGSAKWTVDDGSGKTFCVTALGQDGDVCLVEDVETAFSSSSGTVTIKRDCEENAEMEVYYLQSCYSVGYNSITYEMDFTFNSMKTLCAASAYDETDNASKKFLEILKIWKYRMTNIHERTFGGLMISPENKLSSSIPYADVRFRALNYMASIIGKTCPALPGLYLELITEIYTSIHAKNGEIWKEEVTTDGSPLERDSGKWTMADMFLQDCNNQINENPTVPIFHTDCVPQDVSEMRLESQVQSIDDFLNGEKFDFVLEQIWLILNYVTPYCTKLSGYVDNYWSEFPLLIKKELLYPLREQWKNPGMWNTYYPIMFNGFDVDKTRRAMISCVQAMIVNTPSFDPLARPPGFMDTNSSNIRDIVGNAKTKKDEAATDSADKQRRKRQRMDSDSDEIDPNYKPDAVTIMPIIQPSPKPTPKVTATPSSTTEASQAHPSAAPTEKQVTQANPSATPSTKQPTTSVTEVFISTVAPTSPAGTEKSMDESGKSNKKKKKHSKKGKKGKSGKRHHSKNKKKHNKEKESDMIV